MAAKKQAAKAGLKAGKAGTNAASTVAAAYASPYVQRFLQDPQVREDLLQALDAGRSALHRLSNGKSPQKVLLDDKRFQKEVRQASDSLKSASESLRQGPKKKRSGGIFRLLLLVLVGGGVALGVSEGLRNKALDLLFGAEEEFDYTSTTTPPAASTPPVTPASATTAAP